MYSISNKNKQRKLSRRVQFFPLYITYQTNKKHTRTHTARIRKTLKISLKWKFDDYSIKKLRLHLTWNYCKDEWSNDRLLSAGSSLSSKLFCYRKVSSPICCQSVETGLATDSSKSWPWALLARVPAPPLECHTDWRRRQCRSALCLDLWNSFRQRCSHWRVESRHQWQSLTNPYTCWCFLCWSW